MTSGRYSRAMTDLSRGARVRRGGRRPGWVLLTALLVLAIGASSALVFTNRVELLKLAVILALWAAVVAAFVSVIYRRQSDVDQARARDLKLVYDLQLDREISARREYELTVESQLRRELTSELRAHAADEVSALAGRVGRAAHQSGDPVRRRTQRASGAGDRAQSPCARYSDWEREHESARDRVNRVTSVRAEGLPRRADDRRSSTCPRSRWLLPPRQPARITTNIGVPLPARGASETPGANRAPRHMRRRDAGNVGAEVSKPLEPRRTQSTPPTGWAAPAYRPRAARSASLRAAGRRGTTPEADGWVAPTGAAPASAAERYEPQAPRRSHRRQEAPPQPEPPHSSRSGPSGRHRLRRLGIRKCPLLAAGELRRTMAAPRNSGQPLEFRFGRQCGRRPWEYDNAPSRGSHAAANPRRLSGGAAIPAPPSRQGKSANP